MTQHLFVSIMGVVMLTLTTALSIVSLLIVLVRTKRQREACVNLCYTLEEFLDQGNVQGNWQDELEDALYAAATSLGMEYDTETHSAQT